MSALGVYEVEINGERAGDHVLAPGWTSYNHRLRYQAFDVTPLLRDGANAIGGMLGDGWYRGRIGFGAMQLAGPGVFGPPKDRDAALEVLREAVAQDVNHIDTSDFYGPHVTNQIIREALHPYPDDLVIVTKISARLVEFSRRYRSSSAT